MDPHDISRLKAEQLTAVSQTEEKIHKLKEFKTDYKHLHSRLKTLPDRVTHEVMVPFGPLAFMPGHLVHTNEILVFLGDNWFVERSAKQACEILKRRIDGLDQQMLELDKQMELLKPRLDFTAGLQDLSEAKGDVFEIKEEYDPEAEKAWKKKHEERVRLHHQRAKEQVGKSTKSEPSDEELWARLDDLQKQERVNRELSRLPEVSSKAVEDTRAEFLSAFTASSVSENLNDERVGMQAVHGEEDEDAEEESSSEEDETIVRTIHFSHSATPGVQSSPSDDIVTPADIYAKYVSQPKSILKSGKQSPKGSSVSFDVEGEGESPRPPQVKKDNVPPPFQANVVERSSPAICEDTSQSSKTEAKPLKVSRFKAGRVKKS